MSTGELSFDSPPFLRFTWKIPDFFRLVTESQYSLQSPDFTFADDLYCLELFKGVRYWAYDNIGIRLLNMTNTYLGRAVVCEFQLNSRVGESDLSNYIDPNNGDVFFSLSALQRHKDHYAPNGTLTLLFSVRLRTTGSAGSTELDGAQGEVCTIYRIRSGDLSFQSFPFLYITWTIPGFFKLSPESECTLQSPEFPFTDRRYCLRLLFTKCDTQYVIHILNLTGTDPLTHSYEVGLKSICGKEIYTGRRGPNIPEFQFLRIVVDGMKNHFPDGHLTVFCFMRSREPISGESPMSGGSDSQVFPVLTEPVPQAATHPRSVKVETSNEEEDKEALPEFKKLMKDLNSLLVSGENSDVCLVVGGKEFPVHKNILCARSPVFKAMLCHDTSERESGTVNINDCDPDGFQDFLTYVYTGSTTHIDNGNMTSMYTTSNKYLMSELKEACVSFIKDNISVEAFCGIATLALRYDDNDLIESATKFFCENAKEIIKTDNWVTFLHDYSKQANEHFIKPSACIR